MAGALRCTRRSLVIPGVALRQSAGALRQLFQPVRQPTNVGGANSKCIANLHEFFQFTLRSSDAAGGAGFQIVDSSLQTVHLPLSLMQPRTGKLDFEIVGPGSKDV